MILRVACIQPNAKPDLKANLDEVAHWIRAASADVKQSLRESKRDIPAIVQSGRSAAQDAADITNGLKNTWPISGAIRKPDGSPLPLDSFEGRKP